MRNRIPPAATLARLAAGCALVVAGWGFAAPAARADIFVVEGGEVRGKLLNGDESPRTRYVIQTAAGGRVTLEAGRVKEVKKQSAAEMRYDQILPQCPDTADGHWKMAEWCAENRLSDQRERHLARLIELEPDHADARRALGYVHIDGRWVTQEQLMTEKGYVRSKFAPGKWVLPQEDALLERQEKTKNARLDWRAKIARWSKWLGTDKHEQAVANLRAIEDPFAVSALVKFLNSEAPRGARLLYLRALGRVNTPPAMEQLVTTSLFDLDEEIRLAALEEVVAHRYRPAVARYVQALRHKDNRVINRAALSLGEMKDPSAIGPLIDALVTTHTFRLQRGQPGQTTTAFGTGPNSGSFSMGGSKVEIIKRQFENRAVLGALVDLTGGVSFNYDINAWKNWYVAQRKPKTLDARRDSPR